MNSLEHWNSGCMLRRGLAGGVESGESSFEETAKPTPVQALHRLEHYELVMGEDGKPIELARGAMGITYKAFDVDLRCPVTLKVISEKYLGDKSARLRFLREARAAARLRHSNVASVFHLGRTGNSYFYAMEFVEGEALENLIKRSGRLEIKLALEVATQVAAGLAAVDEQHLSFGPGLNFCFGLGLGEAWVCCHGHKKPLCRFCWRWASR
jgi:serine/threonine protein kinase